MRFMEQGKANWEVGRGGVVLEQWVHGELKAPVAMAGGGGVLGERGWGKSKKDERISLRGYM